MANSGLGPGRADPQETHKTLLHCGHHGPAVAAREGDLGSCFLLTAPLIHKTGNKGSGSQEDNTGW